MKAPSPFALQALRTIALPSSRPVCVLARGQRRSNASMPSKERKAVPAAPPTPEQRPTISPHQYKQLPASNAAKEKDEDEKDQKPVSLGRPIGMPTPPQPGDNHGVDQRSLRERRDDFVNYEKHLEKRARMTKQMAKPYFRDWSNLRFEKGKSFIAPERLFKADVSLWFPNFFGRTLEKERPLISRRKDGYNGYGRDTCEVMRGKVSVVSVVSSQWAQQQVASFCSKFRNPALAEITNENADVVQRLWINYEPNVLKYWLIRLFSGSLRKERGKESWGKYFIVRRGFTDIMREATGFMNEKVGYVYLVDADCRIRWAGSAIATNPERDSMVKGLRRLIVEERKRLQDGDELQKGNSSDYGNKNEAVKASDQ